MMRVFAFDHRIQMEALADELGVGHERIGIFKQLCLDAAAKVAAGRGGYGILCATFGSGGALYRAAAGQGCGSADRSRFRARARWRWRNQAGPRLG